MGGKKSNVGDFCRISHSRHSLQRAISQTPLIFLNGAVFMLCAILLGFIMFLEFITGVDLI